MSKVRMFPGPRAEVRLIGYWWFPVRTEEASELEVRLPHPADLVRRRSSEERERIARYLDAGETTISMMQCGWSWCRFGCFGGKSVRQMGSCVRSDGVWAWPEGLSHYVRVHSVGLPEEFERFAADRSWSPDRLRVTPVPTLEYWIEWARSQPSRHRDGANERTLRWARKALPKERARAARDLARRIAVRVREQGTSEEACIWHDCKGHALRGMRICAACLESQRGV